MPCYHDSNSKVDVFSDYAETDLDQPTDYSLRYAEDDTDEDEKQGDGYFVGNEQPFVQEDTVKTYCTEGTPYETPLNFSNATSMSDLRVDDAKDANVAKKSSLKNTEPSRGKESETETKPLETRRMVTPESKTPKPVSERSSSQVSPEKSVNYCEEVVDKEGKMVTFGGEDHYAEQTPLMFSRCSSLGSLGGFEQHSIHDDRSSIVSDFSWSTSGIVSPSELPDSPTQTVPQSPRHHKSHAEFIPRPQDESSKLPVQRLLSIRATMMKRSVFEDDIAAFKEESTPIEFSAATSLSSLTIDDEPKINADNKRKDNAEKLETVILEEKEESISSNVEEVDTSEIVDNDAVSDAGEDDEGMLAACINIGMQSIINRKEENKSPVDTGPPDIVETPNTEEESDDDEADDDDEDMLAACINIGMHSTFRNRVDEQTTPIDAKVTNVAGVIDVDEISDAEDEEGILAACINIGMQSIMNRADDSKSIAASEVLNGIKDKEARRSLNNDDDEDDENNDEDEDDDSEGMLNACINIGMQNTHGQSFRRLPAPKAVQPVSNLARYQTRSALNHLDNDSVTNPPNGTSWLRSAKNNNEDTAIFDSVHIYCTEDTPANISPAGSHSNLSVLSMLSGRSDLSKSRECRIVTADTVPSDTFSIDGLTLAEDDDVIVARLIESGMRKVQINGNPPSVITLSVSKKPEPERPCSTPLSSPAELVNNNNNNSNKSIRVKSSRDA